jgi:hypothetical protein
MNAMTNLPLHDRRPVSIRPISARGLIAMSGDRRATHAGAYANYLYITRQRGHDARGFLDYRHRDDLTAWGLELSANHPCWAEEPGRIWREIDAACEDGAVDAVRAWHIVLTLQDDLPEPEWVPLVRGFVRETLVRRGPAVAWAIHAQRGVAGGWMIRPHAHLLMTTRGWKHNARFGQNISAWRGAAVRSAIHADWIALLPPVMRQAATTPYRYGGYTPAHPDCSKIAHHFAGARSEVSS